MQNVLILGGFGFLGGGLSHLFDELGWRHVSTSRRELASPHKLFETSNPGSLKDVLVDGKFSTVVNLLGNVSAPGNRGLDTSQRHEFLQQLDDAKCALADLSKIIHVGSCAEYGSSGRPHVETISPQPVSDYGRGKLEETFFFRSLASDGLPVVILRPSIVYGGGQTGDMLVPAMVREIKNGMPFVLKQPNLVRDFLYIKDFSNAVVAAITSSSDSGEIYNIGSGSPTYVWEFASELASALGAVPGQLLFEEPASLEFSSRIPEIDVSLSEQELGWRSRFQLKEAIQDMVTNK